MQDNLKPRKVASNEIHSEKLYIYICTYTYLQAAKVREGLSTRTINSLVSFLTCISSFCIEEMVNMANICIQKGMKIGGAHAWNIRRAIAFDSQTRRASYIYGLRFLCLLLFFLTSAMQTNEAQFSTLILVAHIS